MWAFAFVWECKARGVYKTHGAYGAWIMEYNLIKSPVPGLSSLVAYFRVYTL